MYGIGALASQLLVSEATTRDMRHNTMKAFAIMRSLAIVVAEHLFVQIAEHVKRLNRNVRAFQPALEQAPEVFQSVGMDLAINVLLGVVNRLVSEVLIVEPLIGQKRVCVDRALGLNVSANLGLQVMLAAGWNHNPPNLTPPLRHGHKPQFFFYSALCD